MKAIGEPTDRGPRITWLDDLFTDMKIMTVKSWKALVLNSKV